MITAAIFTDKQEFLGYNKWMQKTISKTDFVRYLECPRYGWLYKNRPDLLDKTQSRIAKQGGQVEELAHGLFPKGIEVPWKNAFEETMKLLKNGTPVIYQATLKTDKYLARADILVKDKDGKGWHLYEVKSSTQVKPEHIPDICFQTNLFEECGMKLYSINIIHINNKYVFDEKKGLEIKKFLIIENLTEKIRENQREFADLMTEAHTVLTSPDEPHPKILAKSFNYDPGPLLNEYYWKGIPDYSIYNIGRIYEKELAKLTEEGIIAIRDIPEGFFKNERKNLQVEITKTEKPFIDRTKIAETMSTLEYPLYFLDYETVNPAVPLFDGTRPYQMICFQYSLHVQRTPKSKLEHYEFLHTEKDNPVPHLLKQLQSESGNKGTVFVWNQGFEKVRNNEMGKEYPEYRDFLEALNARVYDLMKIVSQGMYEDFRFKGSASIKKVLPVLVPELSYENLDIGQGGEAMDAWYEIMGHQTVETKKERAETIKSMLEYCKQDTLAMVKILEFLKNLH